MAQVASYADCASWGTGVRGDGSGPASLALPARESVAPRIRDPHGVVEPSSRTRSLGGYWRHRGLDALHCARGNAKLDGDLAHSLFALRERRTDSGFGGRVDLWPA
jgi:hypothetical protein